MAATTTNNLRTIKFSFNQPVEGPVYLAGTFNDWNPSATPMKCGRDGCWKCSVKLSPGQHQYRYYANGQWFTDELNAATIPNQFGDLNNVLQVEPPRRRVVAKTAASTGKARSK